MTSDERRPSGGDVLRCDLSSFLCFSVHCGDGDAMSYSRLTRAATGVVPAILLALSVGTLAGFTLADPSDWLVRGTFAAIFAMAALMTWVLR